MMLGEEKYICFDNGVHPNIIKSGMSMSYTFFKHVLMSVGGRPAMPTVDVILQIPVLVNAVCSVFCGEQMLSLSPSCPSYLRAQGSR